MDWFHRTASRIPASPNLRMFNARPASSHTTRQGLLTIVNELDHTDLSQYLSISYEVRCDGAIVEHGDLDLNEPVPPHATTTLRCEPRIPESGRCHLLVTYRLARPEPLLTTGHILGFDEVPLHNSDARHQRAVELAHRPVGNQPLSVSRTATRIDVVRATCTIASMYEPDCL